MLNKPLEGIRVIGFTWYVAGPQVTKTLAMYGAEVISIEGRSRPDPQRLTRPFKDDIPGLNRSGDFNQFNTGKLSIALNLARPEGVEIARRLVACADVVVENFAGGVMKRMGLDYEELVAVKPDIIMLSTSMQGQTGQYANHPGTGQQLTALAGFTQITGWPDREPLGPDGPYPDYIAPRLGVLAILSALDYRRRTGKGQYIDLSQFECAIHFMEPLIMDYRINSRVKIGMGNQCPFAAPHGVYRCRGFDRWCAIAVSSDKEWQAFCCVTGKPGLASDTRFSTLLARKANEDELDKTVEEWTINHTASEVMALLQSAGIAAGIVENSQDHLEEDPQLKHRHLFWELEHPETGKYYAASSPFILSRAPCELQRAPLLGEHNEYVLKNILGMPDEEIAELVIGGIFE